MGLQRITIVERNVGRVERLRNALEELLAAEPSASVEEGVHRLDLDILSGATGSQSAPRSQGAVEASLDEVLTQLQSQKVLRPPRRRPSRSC